MRSGRPSGGSGRIDGSGVNPNVEADPVFGSVRSGDEISTEVRAEAALTSDDRSEGRRDRTCGAADLRECELHGLVEGRNCSAAKRRVPDGSDHRRRRVWTSVPARRSWLRSRHVGCLQGRGHQGEVCRKCDTRRPAALVSMPPEAVLRRGPSHRGRASGSWKATGPRQQCRGLFSSGSATAQQSCAEPPRERAAPDRPTGRQRRTRPTTRLCRGGPHGLADRALSAVRNLVRKPSRGVQLTAYYPNSGHAPFQA